MVSAFAATGSASYNLDMPSPPPLQQGFCYHIFNRGINGEDLFREERNYPYSLHLYTLHIQPVAETFAFCLMKNHFHLAVRIKEIPTADTKSIPPASQAFASLFNAYTKAINKSLGAHRWVV